MVFFQLRRGIRLKDFLYYATYLEQCCEISKVTYKDLLIRLNNRNGDSSNFIFGRETKAHETAPTYGSLGINRSLTQSSPSMSKFRTPTGTTTGTMPNFSDSIKSIRAPPV